MKNIKLCLLSLACALSFVGCGNTTPSENNESSNTPISENPSAVIDKYEGMTKEEYEKKYFSLPDGWKDESLYCSQIDDLIDVTVDKAFVTGVSYKFGYQLNTISSEYSEATSSNEDVFTLEKTGEGRYKMIAKHAGIAYFTVMDSNMLVRYRHKVIVLDPYTYDDMIDYLAEVEYWYSVVGYGESYNLTFFYDYEVSLVGTVNGTKFSYLGTYEFSEETETEYMFKFTDDDSKQLNFIGFNISKCGDFMYFMDKWGAAAIMFPQFDL